MEKTTSQQEWNHNRQDQASESFWYMVKIGTFLSFLVFLFFGVEKKELFIILFLFALSFLSSSGSCTSRDISISQSRDSSTSGIPRYIVQIANTCVCGCAPSNIHLHCGWFASARMVNRMTFKRLSYDDCLVNEGKPLKTSEIISFTYSNSFMYPLTFKSAKFCWTSKNPTVWMEITKIEIFNRKGQKEPNFYGDSKLQNLKETKKNFNLSFESKFTAGPAYLCFD